MRNRSVPLLGPWRMKHATTIRRGANSAHGPSKERGRHPILSMWRFPLSSSHHTILSYMSIPSFSLSIYLPHSIPHKPEMKRVRYRPVYPPHGFRADQGWHVCVGSRFSGGRC
ncbi:hypothetical protein BC832DRAFT_568549 [Gaertneriomyces semiglobifer]|nr:hypothetical protein BC832DRAFT_568549 [Gaertneriomyces semiglobifer]